MDMITLAMAKAYTDSQQLASVEPGKVFTYDGGEDAEFVDIGDTRVVKLSDGIFDVNKVEKIKCVLVGGLELEFTKENFEIVSADGISAINVTHNRYTLPAVFVGDDSGLYGYALESIGYLSYVEFAETIHPIDPKYLPDTVATKADIFGAMEASY